MRPNLIIIGAMKCGTSSLHYYLNLHPQVAMSKPKELDFFTVEHNWNRGIDWYESHFSSNADVRGESSPNYSVYPLFSGVPRRMYAVIPNAKLIFMVRDPVERMVSQYVHNYSSGRERRSIADAFAKTESSYVWRSKYYMQLEQYLPYFELSNILILPAENLHHKRRETLQQVFRFLTVDDSFDSSEFDRVRHRSRDKRRRNRVGHLLKQALGKNSRAVLDSLPSRLRSPVRSMLLRFVSDQVEKPVLEDGLRGRLLDLFSGDVDRLRKCTGHEFKDWSV